MFAEILCHAGPTPTIVGDRALQALHQPACSPWRVGGERPGGMTASGRTKPESFGGERVQSNAQGENRGVSADDLVSRDEININAVILRRKPRGFAVGDPPTLGITVRWIAEIGGFTNKGTKVHPGKEEDSIESPPPSNSSVCSDPRRRKGKTEMRETVRRSGRHLGCLGLHLHIATEVPWTARETNDGLCAVGAVEGVGSKVSVFDAVAEHVKGCGQQGRGNSKDGEHDHANRWAFPIAVITLGHGDSETPSASLIRIDRGGPLLPARSKAEGGPQCRMGWSRTRGCT